MPWQDPVEKAVFPRTLGRVDATKMRLAMRSLEAKVAAPEADGPVSTELVIEATAVSGCSTVAPA